MAKQSVDALVSGGKASAAPPLGPALGPFGVNIGKVISAINDKTKSFAGMQVPVKITVDTETKEFEISIGTPPASELIKKEAGVEKGAGNPKTEMIADLRIEQIIKIAQMKEGNLLGKDAFQRVKEVCGTCNSMGIMVEGKRANLTIQDINAGMFKDKILSGKTELSAAELKALADEKKRLQEEIKNNRDRFLKQANEIKATLVGKENRTIRKTLLEAKIPLEIVNEVAPEEKSAAAPGAAKK